MEELTTAPWFRRVLVAGLLAGLVILAFEVLKPFIVPVIWAVILAHVTWPLFRRLLRALRGRRSLTALLMTLGVALAIILPGIWLVALIRGEVVNVYTSMNAQLTRGFVIPQFVLDLPGIGAWVAEFAARVAEDPRALGNDFRQWIERSTGEVTGLLGGVGRNIAKLLIALLSLYFCFRDGEGFAQQLVRVLEQYLGARVHGYVDAISQTVRAVVYGLLAAALAQGTLAGVGYWIAGLDAPIALGALTVVAALIPFMTPVVWIGASVWLLLAGQTGAAVGLFLWGLLAVSWIDNVVRPLVISNATRIPFLLVMFGVLGGVVAFGLVGLFVGPVILAVVMAVWREWIAEKKAYQPMA